MQFSATKSFPQLLKDFSATAHKNQKVWGKASTWLNKAPTQRISLQYLELAEFAEYAEYAKYAKASGNNLIESNPCSENISENSKFTPWMLDSSICVCSAGWINK